MRRAWGRWSAGALAFLICGASPWLGPAAAQMEQPKRGGTLRAAMIGEPPSLDLHWTTATITQQVTWHFYETLFTLDAKFQPIPHLAEGYEAMDGAKRYLIRLRKGVKFHNGKEMTAADVVASLERWGRVATPGKATFQTVEAVEAKGPSAIEVRLKEPSAVLIMALAIPGSAAVIYPKEVIEATGDGQLKQFIGTGPFKFVEHKPDRHIKVVRFDEYAARPEAPNGYGGRRTAYVDEILFIPVPDVAVRLAGAETGEYHFAQQIKQDQYDRVKAMPALEPSINKPGNWATAVFNMKQGLFTDKRLRQAFHAALDKEPIMEAAFGHAEFYRLDPGISFREQAWFSTVGAERFNERDKDKARRLLKEAGYQGQPVRWITTREYEWMYKIALVSKQQLEEVGFKIDLQVLDWATLVQRGNKPEVYDVFSTGFTMAFEPSLGASVQCNWPGWWCTPEKEQLLQAMMREPDFKARYALWEKVQALFWEEMPRVKYGDSFSLDVKRKELKGFRTTPHLFFWNAWLDKR